MSYTAEEIKDDIAFCEMRLREVRRFSRFMWVWGFWFLRSPRRWLKKNAGNFSATALSQFYEYLMEGEYNTITNLASDKREFTARIYRLESILAGRRT